MDTRLLIKLRKEAKKKVRIRKRYRGTDTYVIGTRHELLEYIGDTRMLKSLIKTGYLIVRLYRARTDYILYKTNILRKKRDKKTGKQLYKQCREL